MHRSIEEVLAAHNEALFSIPGVVATAIGVTGGSPCIRVFVTRTIDEMRERVPMDLEGYPVSIEVTDTFRVRPERGGPGEER